MATVMLFLPAAVPAFADLPAESEAVTVNTENTDAAEAGEGSEQSSGQEEVILSFGEPVSSVAEEESREEASEAAELSEQEIVLGTDFTFSKSVQHDAMNAGTIVDWSRITASDLSIRAAGGTNFTDVISERPEKVATLAPIATRQMSCTSTASLSSLTAGYVYNGGAGYDGYYLLLQPGFYIYEGSQPTMIYHFDRYEITVVLHASVNYAAESVACFFQNDYPEIDVGNNVYTDSSMSELVMGGDAFKPDNQFVGIGLSVNVKDNVTGQRINYKNVYQQLLDIDYRQCFRRLGNPYEVSNSSASNSFIESAELFNEDQHQSGLYNQFVTASIEGTNTRAGDVYSPYLTEEPYCIDSPNPGQANLYSLTSGLQNGVESLVFGFRGPAGSSIEYYTDSIPVHFRAASGGHVTAVSDFETTKNGIVTEPVYPEVSPVYGAEAVPSENYEFVSWTVDQACTLQDGTAFEAGAVMTMEQIKQVKVVRELTFTANFRKPRGSITLEAVKNLEGRDLQAEEFQFALYESADLTAPLASASNKADGSIQFKLDYLLSDVGSKTYYLREIAGTENGMTYSDSVFRYQVTVSNAGNGTLETHADVLNGPAVFQNTYVKPARSITVNKSVTGNMGSRSQAFEFRLKLSGDDLSGSSIVFRKGTTSSPVVLTDGEYAFTLSHGEEAVFEEIPVGTSYTIEEVRANKDAYTTTVSGDPATGTLTEDLSIQFTNNRGMGVPTQASIPLFAGIGLLVGGIVLLTLMLLRRRRTQR